MPYTTPIDRSLTERNGPTTVGDLNYLLTTIGIDYMEYEGGLSYTNVNNFIGVLESGLAIYLRGIADDNDSSVARDIAWQLQLFHNTRLEVQDRGAVRDSIRGVIRCCAFEFYHRVGRPYEDDKIRANGDVFPEKFVSGDPRARNSEEMA